MDSPNPVGRLLQESKATSLDASTQPQSSASNQMLREQSQDQPPQDHKSNNVTSSDTADYCAIDKNPKASTSTARSNGKSKPKKSKQISSTIGSSLRRLITLTFSKNSSNNNNNDNSNSNSNNNNASNQETNARPTARNDIETCSVISAAIANDRVSNKIKTNKRCDKSSLHKRNTTIISDSKTGNNKIIVNNSDDTYNGDSTSSSGSSRSNSNSDADGGEECSVVANNHKPSRLFVALSKSSNQAAASSPKTTSSHPDDPTGTSATSNNNNINSNGKTSISTNTNDETESTSSLAQPQKQQQTSPHLSPMASNGNDKLSSLSSSKKQPSHDSGSVKKEGSKSVTVWGNTYKFEGKKYIECPLCVGVVLESTTPRLDTCSHRVCLDCMQRYIETEINHSRLNITCPMCTEFLHPNTIKKILKNDKLYSKYESFLLRRVLASEPDARWCPAPDCGYAVVAEGCATCPRLICGREGCNTAFCYHCKQEWHPNQTCTAASIQRNKKLFNTYTMGDLIEEASINPNQSASDRKFSKASQQTTNTMRTEEIKECPVCGSRIIKMNDGSCNHMTCSICESEFCWLCMKEITDLHYFSPSGCTFWGKKPWSRKKKLLWQLGMLVGAPICIMLIAGIAVPAIVIGIPVWAARKLHASFERKPCNRYKKNVIITCGVLASFVVSPLISAAALAIGVPVLLGYVYGVVPISLCRSSGGCLSAAPSVENLQNEFRQRARSMNFQQGTDVISIDTANSNKIGDPSIGETSLYMSNISLETNSIGHLTTVERDDRESASNAALAGSINNGNLGSGTGIGNQADDGFSTRALAGSILSKESGYTLVPAEVHCGSPSRNQTASSAQC